MLPLGVAVRAFFLRLRSILLTPPCTAFVPRAWMLSSEEVMAAEAMFTKKLLAMNR